MRQGAGRGRGGGGDGGEALVECEMSGSSAGSSPPPPPPLPPASQDASLSEYPTKEAWLHGRRPRRTICTAAKGTTIQWCQDESNVSGGGDQGSSESPQLLAIETSERSFTFRVQGGSRGLSDWIQALRAVRGHLGPGRGGEGGEGGGGEERAGGRGRDDPGQTSASYLDLDLGLSAPTFQDAADLYSYFEASFDTSALFATEAGGPEENSDEIGLENEVRPDTLNHLVSFAGALDIEGYGDLRLVEPGWSHRICFAGELGN